MLYRNKRRLLIGISLLLLLTLYFFKNYSSTIRVMGVILGLGIFYFFDHAFHIHYELKHYVYIIVVLVFGIFLSPLYFLSEFYDKFLHFVMPIFGCLVLFFIVNKMQIPFKYKLVITFVSIICVLTMLEIGEYIFDFFWDFKLQGVYVRNLSGSEKYQIILDKNDDTMIDLIMGIGGSIIFVIGRTFQYYYNKWYSKAEKFRFL